MKVNSDIQPLCFFSCWHHRYLGEFGGWGFSCFFSLGFLYKRPCYFGGGLLSPSSKNPDLKGVCS